MKTIPKEVKKEIQKLVEQFNEDELDLINEFYKYVVEYSGNYAYLKSKLYDDVSPAGRLKYTGDMNNWEFAIYRYSIEEYVPDEAFFPGESYLDGTITGALYCCNTAYPPTI